MRKWLNGISPFPPPKPQMNPSWSKAKTQNQHTSKSLKTDKCGKPHIKKSITASKNSFKI